MPILTTDLVNYLAASMPENDTATSGGAIDATGKPDLVQWAANNIAQVVSDGADTRVVTVTGRNAAGAIVSDAITLNGAVAVSGVVTFERVLKVVTTSNASRTVLVKEAAGGTTRATFIPLDVTKRALFYDSASGAGILIRYEKLFWRNNHATLTLTNATVTLTTDAAARIRIANATAVDDSGSVANRLTLPGGLTFVDDSVAQAVPGGAVAAASRIGVWIEQNLPANDPATKSTFTTQIAGTTT